MNQAGKPLPAHPTVAPIPRPVDQKRFASNVVEVNKSPETAVVAAIAIVTHNEEMVFRNLRRTVIVPAPTAVAFVCSALPAGSVDTATTPIAKAHVTICMVSSSIRVLKPNRTSPRQPALRGGKGAQDFAVWCPCVEANADRGTDADLRTSDIGQARAVCSGALTQRLKATKAGS